MGFRQSERTLLEDEHTMRQYLPHKFFLLTEINNRLAMCFVCQCSKSGNEQVYCKDVQE